MAIPDELGDFLFDKLSLHDKKQTEKMLLVSFFYIFS